VSGRIVSYKNYVAGWFDSSVHDFLAVISPAEPTIKYALITCLDSQPEPASLLDKSPELKPVANKFEIVGTSLLLPIRRLIAIDSKTPIFFGFDEVWFFPTRDIQPKPPSLSIVGPARLTRVRLMKLAKWMAENSCSLALGGGEGLNFVVEAHGLTRFLLGYSIEQPEPAGVSA
jgi:hypothetical protein